MSVQLEDKWENVAVPIEEWDKMQEKNEWVELKEEFRTMKKEKERIVKEEIRIKERFKELCGDETNVSKDGFKVAKTMVKGATLWRTIPELAGLSEQYFDSFRDKEFPKWNFTFVA